MKIDDIIALFSEPLNIIKRDDKIILKNCSTMDDGNETSIVFLDNKKNIQVDRKYGLIICKPDMAKDVNAFNIIIDQEPKYIFSIILKAFEINDGINGISAKASIDKSVVIEKNVAIGSFTVIREGTRIGKNCIIYPNVYIGKNVNIGKNSIIFPGVVIVSNTVIGNDNIIHSNAVIGSDGFGYILHNKTQHKIPQIGKVRTGDRVEIGAATTIDRAMLGDTIIGSDTKIDNLVQIGHNVIIGKNCVIMAQVGIAGSSIIEDNVMMAGQVGLADHVHIRKGAILAAKTGVSKEVGEGEIVFGYPSLPISKSRRIFAASMNLPELLKRVKKLEIELNELKKYLN